MKKNFILLLAIGLVSAACGCSKTENSPGVSDVTIPADSSYSEDTSVPMSSTDTPSVAESSIEDISDSEFSDGDSSMEDISAPDSSVESITETSDILYAALIPDPKSVFSNGKITITDPDGGKGYSFEVFGFTENEYETYIDECKKLGFTEISYEKEEEFGAYSSDKEYWLMVVPKSSENKVWISCSKSQKN